VTIKTNSKLERTLDAVIETALAENNPSFRALAEAAKLDPAQDFRGADLRGVDLRDEDLKGFDFSDADLTGADLRRAKVTGAIFARTILDGTIGVNRAQIIPPQDFDIRVAHAMALAGRDPPESWRPYIAKMQFGSELKKISQLPDMFWLAELTITFDLQFNLEKSADFKNSQYARLGRLIVERLFQRAKMAYSDEKLIGALPRLARTTLEDVMAAVGRSELKASDVARAMYSDYKEERAAAMAAKPKSESGWFGLKKLTSVKFKVPNTVGPAIPIRGINGDLPVRFAPEGGAVPGDRIVGILTPGEGITIYPIQSAALSKFEETPERWLDVRWDEEENTPRRFSARIAVQSVNEPGSLAQIAQVIAEHDGNIDNVHMTRRAPNFTDVQIDLEVYDLNHLTAIISQLSAVKYVERVERVNG